MCATRILAVDDEEHVRKLLKDALTLRGYEVELASDGVDAAKRLRDEEFDIIVTDLQMPRMDGRRLARLASQIRPGIGIIIITAHPSDKSILDTFSHGAVNYLLKPFDLRELFRSVRDVERERRDLAGKVGTGAGGATPVRIECPRDGLIEFEAPSHQIYIERFTNIFEALLRTGLSEEELDDIRIAVHELGANAVEWGNAGDVRRPVRISAIIDEEQLVLVIEDQGGGFVPDHVPDPIKDPEGVADGRRLRGKRPGGYGIAMARAAMDDVFYNKGGNTVVMTKRFKSPLSGGPSPSPPEDAS